MSNEEKKCPFCGEIVKTIALKCKHCKSELNNLDPLVEDRNILNSETLNRKQIVNELKYELIPHGFIVSSIVFILIGIFIQIAISILIFDKGKYEYTFEEIYYGKGWLWFHNIVFIMLSQLDYYNLKKIGIHVKYGFISSLIYTPVYLYLRGTELNKIYSLGWGKSQSFFIGWITLWIISFPIEAYLLGEGF
jgi:hypothetical protein